MKKLFHITCSTILCLLLLLGYGCNKEEQDKDNLPGSIYGIVTESGSNVPLEKISIHLYQGNLIVGSIYTSADGSFEFTNIDPGVYRLDPDANGYYSSFFNSIIVKSGKASRFDITITPMPGENSHGRIRTLQPTVSLENTINLHGELMIYDHSSCRTVGFVVSKSERPSIDGRTIQGESTSNFSFIAVASDLDPGKYYVQAYTLLEGRDSWGDYSSYLYGDIRSFVVGD